MDKVVVNGISGSNDDGSALSAPHVFPDEFREAYDRRLDEIKAVEEDAVIPVNADIPTAVATVLGVLPRIAAFRGALVAIGVLDQTLVDGLEDYAEATGEAHTRYMSAIAPPEDIVALNEQALKLRETLRSVAHTLVLRGLIDPARVSGFPGRTGYKNVAFELMGWVNLFLDCWPAIEDKAGLTLDEIHTAKWVGSRLARAAGLREHLPPEALEAARIRQQAFTLLVRAYDEVRRGIQCLRWHEGDADLIAPSLYGGRPRKRAEGKEEAAAAANTEPVATAPVAPPPALTEGGSAAEFR